MNLLRFFNVDKKVDTMRELEIEIGRTQLMVMKVAALTLASVMMAVVLAMVVGLFVPNGTIDTNEIFKIIGPAFSMIVGAFVGAFAAMTAKEVTKFGSNVKIQEINKTNYQDIPELDDVDNEIDTMATVQKYKDSDKDHGPF